MDLEKFDMPGIAEAVVESLVISDQLTRAESKKVLAALLLRHRHQYEENYQLPRRPSMFNLADISSTMDPKNTDEVDAAEVNNAEAVDDEGAIKLNIDFDDAEVSSLPDNDVGDVSNSRLLLSCTF